MGMISTMISGLFMSSNMSYVSSEEEAGVDMSDGYVMDGRAE